MTESVSESENPAIPSPTPKADRPQTNQDWWPNQLDLSVLHWHSSLSNPLDEDFDYAEAFKSLDVEALRRDLIELMTASQEWWPADYGHYGAALHPHELARRGHLPHRRRPRRRRQGAQRFAPLNSWPDNASLDKARRLLWPIKQKYGQKLSWADLLVFTGNVAMESMGFKTFGFGFGREDIWEPEEIFWGPEDTWLGDERYSGERELSGPLGAVQMGLIYVNPEGPNGDPDPLAAAQRHPRDLQPHGDERRGDGRAHRRRPHVRQDPRRGQPRRTSARSPRRAPIEQQGLGWKNSVNGGNGAHTLTSGLEGAWTNEPTKWDNGFLENLYEYEWELTESPAGAKQWTPTNPEAQGTVPDAHDPSKRHAPMMLTTDLALKVDPVYGPITQALLREPRRSSPTRSPRPGTSCCTATWGPVSRYLGPWVPEPQLWQDPVPAVDHELIDEADIAALKETILGLGPVGLPAGRHRLGVGGVVPRHRHARRGERGADPPRAAEGLGGQRAGRAGRGARRRSSRIQQDFNGSQSDGKQVSLADLIVLGGCAAVEQAAKDAGHDVTVPFTPGRTDASQEQTDVDSFAVLEPSADGFRNYFRAGRAAAAGARAARARLHADADRARDDRPDRRHAGAGRQLRRIAARRLHRPARDADQRLLREPARHGHGVGAVRRRERVRGPRPRARARSGGPPPPPTWSSARTPSSGRSRRSTRPTTRARSSSATSSPRGTRS